MVSLNRYGSVWNRNERIKQNDDKQIIEDFINGKIDNTLASEAFDTWINENQLISKNAVATFADLPPSPTEKEVRGVLDEDTVYTWNGSEWVALYDTDFTSIEGVKSEVETARGGEITLGARLDTYDGTQTEVENARDGEANLDARLEKFYDYNVMPQSPKPQKDGISTNSSKIIYKESADKLVVLQKKNKGYLKYTFQRNSGGSGYGVNYELLRVVEVLNVDNVLAYKTPENPDAGSVARVFTSEFPSSSSTLAFIGTGAFTSKSYEVLGEPINILEIASVGYAEYNMGTGKSGKMNIGFYDRANTLGDTSYKISFNGQTLKEGTITTTGTTGRYMVEFNAPIDKTGALRIENTGSGELYIGAINYYELEDLDGQHIDSVKYFYENSNIHFIESSGSSDYAIRNADNNQLFGSYHGGEISEKCEVIKSGNKTDFDSIAIGEFWQENHFSIHQKTNLIELSNMVSEFIFNNDGTLDMDFSWNVNDETTPLNISTFWVALTCTSPYLSDIKVPVIKSFDPNPSNAGASHYYFDTIFGKVVQSSPDGKVELHSRFPMFANRYVGTEKPSSVSDQTQYRKHYYAPIRNYSEGVPLTSFQTSKSLDFYQY